MGVKICVPGSLILGTKKAYLSFQGKQLARFMHKRRSLVIVRPVRFKIHSSKRMEPTSSVALPVSEFGAA